MTYPILKIEHLIKLEVFTYDILLEFIMGYLHMIIKSDVSSILNIILPWGEVWISGTKYGYIRNTSYVAPNTLQEKALQNFQGHRFIGE